MSAGAAHSAGSSGSRGPVAAREASGFCGSLELREGRWLSTGATGWHSLHRMRWQGGQQCPVHRDSRAAIHSNTKYTRTVHIRADHGSANSEADSRPLFCSIIQTDIGSNISSLLRADLSPVLRSNIPADLGPYIQALVSTDLSSNECSLCATHCIPLP